MRSDPRARQITDSRALAAMTHPLRRRMLDALTVDGPATASMLAATTDQAVGNASHHLHVLAAADLIEEAPECARDRRERWWKRSSEALRWNTSDFRGDPAAEVVAEAAASLNLERAFELARAWRAVGDVERQSWAAGPFFNDHWLKLTPDELAELGEELVDLFRRWADRPAPEAEQERRTVFVFALGVPARP
jgi:DNA-binding transcriptional ArsR family regulator